jgi:hypothetical protein
MVLFYGRVYCAISRVSCFRASTRCVERLKARVELVLVSHWCAGQEQGLATVLWGKYGEGFTWQTRHSEEHGNLPFRCRTIACS